jgi:hypothetical protein
MAYMAGQAQVNRVPAQAVRQKQNPREILMQD